METITFNGDFTFNEFVEKVGNDYLGDINEILENNNIKVNPSDVIDFDTACFIVMKLNEKQSSRIVLMKGKINSSKTLSEIKVGESILIDYFPFDKYKRELKCVSAKCRSENLICKLFQMEYPRMIFRIDEGSTFSYYNGKFHLDNPVKELKSVNDFYYDDGRGYASFLGKGYIESKLYGDDETGLEKLGNEMKRWETCRLLIKDLTAHKKAYKNLSFPVKDIIESIKRKPESVCEVDEVCKKCGNKLIMFYFRSPTWTWQRLCGRAGDMLICPHCKEDSGIIGNFIMN